MQRRQIAERELHQPYRAQQQALRHIIVAALLVLAQQLQPELRQRGRVLRQRRRGR